MDNSLTFAFPEDYVEPATEEQHRIFHLEAAVRSMLSELQGASNCLLGPDNKKRPMVAVCQISQALAIGRRALGGEQ